MTAFADVINGADTAWIMTSTALVLFMTLPGLALFYGGLVRSNNILSVLMQCFAIAGIVSILWFVAGYSLAFSGDNPFIGNLSNFMLAQVTIDSVIAFGYLSFMLQLLTGYGAADGLAIPLIMLAEQSFTSPQVLLLWLRLLYLVQDRNFLKSQFHLTI
jgi:ammonia channel protein AmtB